MTRLYATDYYRKNQKDAAGEQEDKWPTIYGPAHSQRSQSNEEKCSHDID